MPDDAQEFRRDSCLESSGFSQLFRAFRLATHSTKLLLAFCGILLTYGTGRVMDGIWPSSAEPVGVVASDGAWVETELDAFLRGGRSGAVAWRESLEADAVQHVGTFDLMLHHACDTMNAGTSAVLHGDFRELVGAVRACIVGDLWLFTMHPCYATIFCLAGLVIWSLFGGAICRVAALHAAREERIGLAEALGFARGKFLSFLAAPLMPLGIVLLFAIFLFLGGLVGLIPAVGEVLVGIFFFLALIAGFIIAFVIIGGVAGYALMFPTIAAEGSDAFDALSRTFSYVYQRPWRTAVYAVISVAYGAICMVFVKLLARIMLWSAHYFTGLSMNWGDAFGRDGAGHATRIPGKLDALWQGPSLTGETRFWGGFNPADLVHLSWFGRLGFYLWIFVVFGMVAAFAVSFFYSASTLIYFLLRREVDATDLEDVYLEETPEDVTPSPTTTEESDGREEESGGTSLPVVGQDP